MEYISLESTQEKINRMFDINFDMKDILLTSDIIKEWLEQFSDSYNSNEYIFECIDNNDGKLFIDVTKDGEIKYCFTDYDMKMMTPVKYMNWDFPGWRNSEQLSKEEVKICEDNIAYIKKNAKFMTSEELQDFIDFDYSKQIIELANDLKIELAQDKLFRFNMDKKESEQNKEENDIEL